MKYEQSMMEFCKNFDQNKNFHNYHKIVTEKIKDIDLLFDKKISSSKVTFNKPLLVRLGELNQNSEQSEFYISLREVISSIEHLKQYQEFLLEDIEHFKIETSEVFDKKTAYFKTLSVVLPIVIIILSLVFAFLLHRAIAKQDKYTNQTKDLLQNIINSIPIRLFWKDMNGVVQGANSIFYEDIGNSAKKKLLENNAIPSIFHNCFLANKEFENKVLSTKVTVQSDTIECIEDVNNTLLYIKSFMVPLKNNQDDISGVVYLYEDVTKQYEAQKIIKQQEIQLIHQNRLAQMGEMISMIAHQWRQPLSAISSNIGNLQLKLTLGKFESDYFYEKLEKVVLQTVYLSDTIEDFRNFFRPDKQKNKIFAKELIDDTLRIIDSSLKEHSIQIDTNYSCAKELYTYSNEVKQVLLNIVKNAQDAFISKKIVDARIVIEARCSLDSRCMITIEDNAGGIDKDVIDKIFDPYFSTKSEKNGTGLGLYMSKIIIEKHCEGRLSVESENGITKFSILI